MMTRSQGTEQRSDRRSLPERKPLLPPGEEVPEEQDERIPWGRMFKYLLITIVAIFLLLVLLDKIIMPWYVKLGEVERVPSVVGLGFPEAQKRLEKLGFDVKKGEPRYDDRYPAGTVLRQLPYGGTMTKDGRRIYLTISRGSAMEPMLDLIGMPLREARIHLMRKGFDVGEVAYEYNDTIMRDLIYSQGIPPKVGARPGARVDVMISRGPSTRFTMMPNLISLDVETARVRLQNAGLVLGIIRSKEDPTYITNTVIEQETPPYGKVAEGAAVDITIAKPPGSDPPEVEGDEPEVSNDLSP